MENLALIDSFSEFKDEKLIDRVTLMSILEDVFRNTLKKKFIISGIKPMKFIKLILYLQNSIQKQKKGRRIHPFNKF